MLTRTLGATLAFASVACAQATHLVGPGGYANINAALAIAAPGDVVLVQPGTYPAFQATIGVTIRAVTSGTVSITPRSTVQATQPVHLVGLDLAMLRITDSTCSLDACRVLPIAAQDGSCLSATGSIVYLDQCVVGAGGETAIWALFGNDGLAAIGSTISAVASTLRGRDPPNAFPGFAGVGISLSANSTLHGSGNTLLGGALSGPGSGQALRADNTSRVWLADSMLTGGSLASSSGTQCPVIASLGRLVRCTLSPSTCPPPTIALTGALIGVQRLAPPQAGSPLQVTFRAAPNEQIGVFASFALAKNTFFELEQPAGLDLGSLFALDVLLADGNGVANGSWMLPPGTANLALWLQAVTPGAVPLQLSPVTGGVVR